MRVIVKNEIYITAVKHCNVKEYAQRSTYYTYTCGKPYALCMNKNR